MNLRRPVCSRALKPSSRPLFVKSVNVVTGSLREKEAGLFFFRYNFEIFTKKLDFSGFVF